MPKLTDYVHFSDEKLAKKYRSAEIPMSVLYESYFDGELDIKGDVLDMLRERQGLVKYNITRQHLQWAMTNFVPDAPENFIAGISTPPKSILKTPVDEYRHVIEVNQIGAYTGIHVVAPAIIEAGGGSIVNVSSVNGFQGAWGIAGYASSK